MKFSVITVCYNNRDGLEKTIESVICQTCKDYEFIVIDGGSKDGTKELLEQNDDQIDFWNSELFTALEGEPIKYLNISLYKPKYDF